MKQSFKVRGMHCESCVLLIERTLNKKPGVSGAVVNLTTEMATISYDPEIIKDSELVGAIESKGYKVVKDETYSREKEAAKIGVKFLLSAVLAVPVVVLSMFMAPGTVPGQTAIIFCLATVIQFALGWEFYRNAFISLKNFDTGMDTLVALGTSAAYFYSIYLLSKGHDGHTYFETSSVLITVILLGRFLEAKAKLNASDAIKKLMDLAPKKAVVIRDGAETEIITNEIIPGDIVLIKPGDSIPVDGVITEGDSYIDESMITGESMPAGKIPGDRVISGTINGAGAFRFRADKTGGETTLANIIRLIEQAQGSKAPVQRLADSIASIFVPSVIAISAITFIIWLITGNQWPHALNAVVAVLVIACPCALGLATPAAIMVGSGLGAKNGILIKNAAALENLGRAKFFVFDKTGTITGGIPEITDIISVAENDDELLGIAYSLEKNSTHPLAGAVITRARQGGLALFDNSSFENIAGSGIRAVINGETYIIGSLKWIFSLSIDTSIFAKEIENFEAQGKTVMALAKENRLIGILAASDTVRQSAAPAVEALKQKGISVAMLTGDNIRAAGFMAEQADIDDVIAGLLPDEKLYEIKKMQQKGITVMVGDGINDAPALAAADIGLALSTGTDIAMEAGDVVLMKSDLMLAVKAYNLSRATLAKIKQNLFWAFFYNIIGIPLAAFGLLNPMIAGTAMALSSVSVLTNSLLLKNKKI